MTSATDRAQDQARIAAREFVSRFTREMGVPPSDVVRDRMLFAYELGYLRGRSDAAHETTKRIDDLLQTCDAHDADNAARKVNNDVDPKRP